MALGVLVGAGVGVGVGSGLDVGVGDGIAAVHAVTRSAIATMPGPTSQFILASRRRYTPVLLAKG